MIDGMLYWITQLDSKHHIFIDCSAPLHCKTVRRSRNRKIHWYHLRMCIRLVLVLARKNSIKILLWIILARRYLKEHDACRLFAQLISGVHYLHQKHIVHRDLKLVTHLKPILTLL
jgi:serine/threonine protein kinase